MFYVQRSKQVHELAERYRLFARTEAAGRSPLYERLSIHVSQSPAALALLSTLPPDKRQPNLFFAAFRRVADTPLSIDAFEKSLAEHAAAIRQVMLSRSTQTNEPGRCSVLLPSLASITGDVALIEVGASAGLCLLFEEYGFDWGVRRLLPRQGAAARPIFPCKVTGAAPLPIEYPNIVWRAGLDLNPVDLRNDDDVAWLELLVWPEDADRLERLQAAIRIARSKPPRVVRGNLLRDLKGLMAQAPAGATVVVYHSAVLSYIADQDSRDEFAETMLAANCVWISNESPRVFPQFARNLEPAPEGMFLLTVNGRPQAWTSPHGRELHWI